MQAVEIGVNSYVTDTAVISLDYNWQIKDFEFRNEEKGECLECSTFPTKNDEEYRKWRIKLYPNGTKASPNNCLAIFLQFLGEADVKAKFSFVILQGKNYMRNYQLSSFKNTTCLGFDDFITQKLLFQDYIWSGGSLYLKCRIELLVCNLNSKVNIEKPKCTLSQDFGNILENSELSDVTLEIGDRKIPAHKSILSARSAVFNAMFKHELSESKLNRVSIIDIDYKVIKEMISYIYTGKAPNLNQMAENLLIAANKYDLKGLKVLCEIELCGKISIKTAADILVFADLHDANQLKDKTKIFINSNIVDVFKTQSWRNLMTTNMDLFTEVTGTK